MKKLLLLLVLLAIFPSLTAQKIDFISIGDTLQKPVYQQFIYISDSTDVSNSIFVGKAKCIGELKNVIFLFNSIRSKALEYGANSFKFESFKKLNGENGELILSLYYNEGDFFEHNAEKLPKNKIYIFGLQNLLSDRSQTFKLDDTKYEISAGTYLEFERKEKETKINKGGFSGETLHIKKSEEGFCKFLSFSGIDINGAQANPATGAVGVSFNTGKINNIEPNLALTLMRIYKLTP
jgi:hypothetical protein